MNKMTRFWETFLKNENIQIKDPMVFITGPRQVGKTYLTRQLTDRYFNWDTKEVKLALRKDPYFFRDADATNSLVIFDEIHKQRQWKATLKGYYDSPDRKENFLVTGSGRFDQYKKGGDSLQGRYFQYHMWPLTYDEIYSSKKKFQPPRNFLTWTPPEKCRSSIELYEWGGFPEPFLKGNKSFLNRWLDQYIQRLIYEDVRDFALIEHLDKLELLGRLLPERVTSPLSMKSLSEDVEVSPITIKHWLKLLNTLYLIFELKPFHKSLARAVKKETKVYFYQWAFIDDPAARFENFVAVQLAAVISAWREEGFGLWELFYLRDQDRREIDFLITKNNKPMALIEAKSSFQAWPSSLHYYCDKLKVPGFLVYPKGDTRKVDDKGYSLSIDRFLAGLIH